MYRTQHFLRPLLLFWMLASVSLAGCIGNDDTDDIRNRLEEPADPLPPIVPIHDGESANLTPNQTPTQDACRTFILNPPRAGSSFLYRAEGFFMNPLIGYGILDWRAVGLERESNEVLKMPPDSRIRITIGQEPQERINWSGGTQSAYQITYDAKIPEAPAFLDFADEWIDTENGNPVQMTHRNFWLRGSGVEEDMQAQQRYSYFNRPAALLGSMIWQREYQTGDEVAMIYPNVVALPSMWGLFNGNLRLEVERLYEFENSCRMDATVFAQQPETADSKAVDVYRLTFQEDTPLPIKYDVDFPERPKKANLDPLRMELMEYNGGSGNFLPPLKEIAVHPPTQMKMAPSVDGFLPDSNGVFPTDYSEAMQKVGEDSAGRAWLDAHPDAVPFFVEHFMGEPGSREIDEWRVSLTDGEDQVEFRVVRREPLIPGLGLPDEYEVKLNPASPPGGVPDKNNSWVSLREMAHLYENLTGDALEIISCSLWDGAMFGSTCFIGTHNSTGKLYAGQAGAGTPQPGLVVWITEGWLLQYDGRGKQAVGPPAWSETT